MKTTHCPLVRTVNCYDCDDYVQELSSVPSNSAKASATAEVDLAGWSVDGSRVEYN